MYVAEKRRIMYLVMCIPAWEEGINDKDFHKTSKQLQIKN